MRIQRTRMLAAAIVLALVMTFAPAAQASGSFQAKVTSGSMKVYQPEAPYGYLGALPKGTTVTVEAYSGKAALISYNGRTGLARVSDLAAVAGGAGDAQSESAEKASEAAETATAAELAGAKAVVTTRATRVYKKASKSSVYVSVKAGAKLNLLSVSGSVAKVERNGVVGYTAAAHLASQAAEQPAADAVSQATETAADAGVVRYDRTPVVTTANTRVFSKPSTSSDYVAVDKGTQLRLLAVKGNCAMVERDGKTGYVYKKHIAAASASETSAASTAEIKAGTSASTAEGKSDSSDSGVFSGSNEEVVFKFLTGVAGYNAAAACGIMANIKYESGYKPTSGGDSGTSYGIAQWHAARKTRLINWCSGKGYDYTTLKGQLYYLQYELKTYYPAVHNRLKAVSNTEQGAYDAGYDFCYNFEAPASRASKSVTRGNYARTTLWARYKA